MAITKEKKAQVLHKLEATLKSAKTAVFVGFKGLTVAQQNEMRKALKAQGIGYTVSKKTLLGRALDSHKYEGSMPALEGEIALAYGADELAPAREIGTFVKKFGGALTFVGGVFGGTYVGRDEITAISAIPGMDTLRTMFAQVINSPRTRFAVALGKVAEKKG
ncbi:MAG: 50S ribosomal protein L10 [Patescibacteria group bacterium]|nr:50S ribosomal protein L10 [Patescibacteria group bacterium]